LLKDWRSTANALEAAAEECNDGLLTLDEIHQAEPRDVVGAIYQLANESGKGRLNREAASRRRRTWQTMVMSNGEIDLATMAAKHSSSPLPAGAEVRMPSIPVDGRVMWPSLHGAPSVNALIGELQVALEQQYGTPIRAFLEKLTHIRNAADGSLRPDADEMRTIFYEELPADADSQVLEIARRCAMVALAGELAIKWEILPWEPGDAVEAAQTVLTWWITRRDGVGSIEESQHIKIIRAYLVEHGASRFTVLGHNDGPEDPERSVILRAGWRRRKNECDEYLIGQDSWRKICSEHGADPVEVAKTLSAAGHLAKADGKNLAKCVRLPGVGKIRCYVVLPSIFDSGEIQP
jgi:putative DNA primase/helicase